MKLDVVQLTRDLVAYESPSRASNVAVTRHLARLLRSLSFRVEELGYTDERGVAKLSLVAKLGKGRGGLTFMSHDDVVPASAADGWKGDPFRARVAGGKVYGRGACDMKGPLAASICAAARVRPDDLAAPLFIIVTADEETECLGARDVVRRSRLFSEARTGYGIICEPTRLRVVHAHKGSLAIRVTSRGRSAHTSTLKGVNANIRMIPFLAEMKEIYDLVLSSPAYRNEEFDPPHSEWSIGITDGDVAKNMSPVLSVCTIGYRPMPGIDAEDLAIRTRACARRLGLSCQVRRIGTPLYTPPGSPLVQTALKLTRTRRAATVPYGTDGLAYAARMPQLIVLGPGDISQAHTVDEWIAVEQLRRGTDLYARFIDHVCVRGLP
ncbi:MAG: M20/M25/M40 family metallo-hydrolase [Gemmatimonadota bacterium]